MRRQNTPAANNEIKNSWELAAAGDGIVDILLGLAKRKSLNRCNFQMLLRSIPARLFRLTLSVGLCVQVLLLNLFGHVTAQETGEEHACHEGALGGHFFQCLFEP